MYLWSVLRRTPTSTLFPYTTLFRSHQRNHSETQRLSRVILFVFGLLHRGREQRRDRERFLAVDLPVAAGRSEEHTSELQSHVNLVCRLLLEKKNNRGESERSE